MAPETETSGTPAGTTGDGAATASENPAGGEAVGAVTETPEALKARIAELESIHQQDLARLNSGEDARRRLEDLEAKLEARTNAAVAPPTGMSLAQQQEAEFQRQFARFAMGDPSMTEDEVQAINRAVAIRAEMRGIETQRTNRDAQMWADVPADIRPEARKLYATGRYADPEAATNAALGLQASSLKKQNEELADKLKRETEARRGTPVGTAPATPMPRSDLSRTKEYTAAEWVEVCNRATTGDVGARALLREYDSGKAAFKVKLD